MRKVLGTNLSPRLQKEVLRVFVHRYTADHKPQWANSPMQNGNAYKPQFQNDAEWLSHTYFYVTKNHALAKRRCCESHPTFPYGE